MVIYADSVWTVNCLIDSLMLLLAARLSGFCARPWRCFCAGAFGGVYAVFTLVPGFLFLSSVFWQLVFFILMASIAFGVKMSALRPSALAFLCSSALAGFVFLFVKHTPLGALLVRGGVVYPLGTRILLLLAGVFYLAAALLASGSMRHRRGDVLEIRVVSKFGSLRANALVDTGNTLSDPISGKAVILLDWREGALLMGVDLPQTAYLDAAGWYEKLTGEHPEHRFRLIPYSAVGVSKGLLLSVPCVVYAGKRQEGVYAAFSPQCITNGEGYKALIGGNVF